MTRNIDPIILPTAETTKTSQQIQFSPQSSINGGSSGWPSVPVCFYGPPSSSNSYQQKQTPNGVPFFLPYGATPGNSSLSLSIYLRTYIRLMRVVCAGVCTIVLCSVGRVGFSTRWLGAGLNVLGVLNCRELDFTSELLFLRVNICLL